MQTLLIVDDSRVFRMLLEQILATHFKVVGKATSGIDGFELYKACKPDLVLMDITMPNCSGKECLQKILDFDADARVMMVSSLGDEQTVEECKRIGAKAFLNKDKISLSEEGRSYLLEASLQIVTPRNRREAA